MSTTIRQRDGTQSITALRRRGPRNGPSPLAGAPVWTAFLTAALLVLPLTGHAATPGLPFTEDFADTTLRDAARTNANWSTDEQALLLASARRPVPFSSTAAGGADITAAARNTWEVALGDVDGDGDLDLVTGNYSQTNRLYLNNGTADPWAGVSGKSVSSDAHVTYSVALGDVDSDGDLDMVAGNLQQRNRLYLNNGTADPWAGVTGTNITSDMHATLSVLLGDVDGDGDLDLLVGNYAEPSRLYLNNGTADSWAGVTGTNITADVSYAYGFALGDVDDDGDLDLVVGNTGLRNRLYLNNGTADPWAGVTGSDITTDGWTTTSLALGDVDGDGDLDLVTGNHLGESRLYLNNGTADPWNGVVGESITHDAPWTRDVALGDVDGDGDLDLVVADEMDTNRFYLNNGSAQPWAGVWGTDINRLDWHQTYSLALGDVDGDGDLDLVAGNEGPPNRVYLNNGTADPWAGEAGKDIAPTRRDSLAVALGDVDGDGDLDAVTGNDNQANRLYLNDGYPDPWLLVTGTDITADAHPTHAVALGDVDGDGDLDLVAGNDSQPNRLYLNDGTSAPWSGVTGTDITADAHATRFLLLSDVDRDGDLDLLVGNYNQANRLYLNNGTVDPWNGVTGTNITSDAHRTLALALGDVDGDGDLDLLGGNFSYWDRLYLNNGTAAPWSGVTGSNISSDYQDTTDLSLADVDGDGDLDLMAGIDGGANRLYRNNGTANPWNGVTGLNITSDADQTAALALSDMDGDGDLDLMAGNVFQEDRLYLNNGTTNPWAGVTGTDITLDALYTQDLTLGDVDGDGDPDLVAACYETIGGQGERNRLYRNATSVGSWSDPTGQDVTTDGHTTQALVLGDVDGDGDPDLVAGNTLGEVARLYLNDGSSDPWSSSSGGNITTDADNSRALALGDVDADGDLDLVAGNDPGTNRLYLNDGSGNPWDTVSGVDITTDANTTQDVVLGDVDGDGRPDLVAANYNENHRLYINDGAGAPWDTVSGIDITTSGYPTRAAALGDVDGDGHVDLVTGNDGDVNRVFVNNGTTNPWSGVAGTDITLDAHDTYAIALGDIDHDGDLDLVAGNSGQANRLYRNNGTTTPWVGVTGSDITTDAHDTRSVLLIDIDRDGDLDLVAGNRGTANRLYLNNGTTSPWAGVSGRDITSDTYLTEAVAVGDVESDGRLELVAGNSGASRNRLYRPGLLYDTSRGVGASIDVHGGATPIIAGKLTPVESLAVNGSVDYWLSNDGGVHWLLAQPGEEQIFPWGGTDMRWKAELKSLSPVLSPGIDRIDIVAPYYGLPPLGDRVWEDLDGDGIQDVGERGIVSALVYLYDELGAIVNVAFTDTNGNYSFDLYTALWGGQYYVRFIPPTGYVLAPQDQDSDDTKDSDADSSTGYTALITLNDPDHRTTWDAGMVPSTACFPPDEPVYLYMMTLTTDGNDYPVLHCMDFNQPTQITGYNVYRHSDPAPDPSTWPLVASDVIDGDEATPNKQWVDTSGDVSPTGTWYYHVVAYNHRCPPSTAEGPF